MMMNKINLLAYRLKLRKELSKLPREMIQITYDESKRALESKKK